MSNIDKQALRECTESTISILENIAGFEPSDIDGDTLELRFETEDGFDTGCDVSIVDQCQKAADVVLALLDELEAAEKQILKLEKLAEAESVGADKAAASCVEWMKRCHDAEKRIAELEAREVSLPERSCMLHRTDFHDDYQTVMAYKVSEVIDAIRAAGIRIKGE